MLTRAICLLVWYPTTIQINGLGTLLTMRNIEKIAHPMKSILTILWVLVCTSNLFGQAGWELGFHGGVTGYMGDLTPGKTPETDYLGLNLGLKLGFNFSDNWLLRFDAERSSLEGDDQSFDTPDFTVDRRYSFNSTLYGLSAQLVYEPFGHKRFPGRGGYKKIISPYIFLGVGFASIDSRPDFSRSNEGGTVEINNDLANAGNNSQVLLPVGGGIRFDLSKRASIGLEMSLRTAFTDYLDGISEAANPGDRDWYTTGSISYTFRFTKKDFDRDGIVDTEDDCPRIPGTWQANGCPDADGDGVEDLEDVCPQLAGPKLTNGCPDADFDGVADPDDPCLYRPGTPRSGGCPDADDDGIPDMDDFCPECPGLPKNAGCPDSDGDGVIDSRDRCPGLAGSSDWSGCPEESIETEVIAQEDTPLDSVASTLVAIEEEIDDPKEGSIAENEKVVNQETDNDPKEEETGSEGEKAAAPIAKTEVKKGQPTKEQDLPDIPENRVTESDISAIDSILNEVKLENQETTISVVLATESVQFAFAKAELLPVGKTILKDLAQLMEKYPNYQLIIEGHTDSKGSVKINQALSERRAATCYRYLQSQGIASERLSYIGYGESRPIASNTTEEGRAQNRRVAFVLYQP